MPKKKLELRPYQKRCVDFLLENDGGFVNLPPGAGKTAILLTFLKIWLKKNPGKKFLLTAPLNILYDAWTEEPKTWAPGIRVFNLHKEQKFDPEYDLYLVSPAQLQKLFQKHNKILRRFSGFAVDESTLYKNPYSLRTLAVHKMLEKMNYQVSIAMTGTVITKHLLDIYGQFFVVDQQKLSHDYMIFRSKFFTPSKDGRDWLPKPGAVDEILKRISYRTFTLTDEEYEKVGYPAKVEKDFYFNLTPKMYNKYKQLHKEFLLELEDKTLDRTQHKGKVYAGAVSYGYCTQFTSGNFYEPIFKEVPDPKNKGEKILKKVGAKANYVHRERLNVLEEILNSIEGYPALVAYEYTSDIELFKKLKLKNVRYINGQTNPSDTKKYIEEWNAGKVSVLFAQIRSASHGLNLQKGGNNVIFYQVPDDYEKYFQFLSRIVRPGQKKKMVSIYRIICRGTVDEILRLQILRKKTLTSNNFISKLKSLTV